MISFKAHYIDNINIKKLTQNGEYIDSSASFVELNTNSVSDLDALANVKGKWGKEAKFATKIFNAFEEHHTKSKIDKTEKFYALTSQQGNYKNLESNKILGIAQIYKDVGDYFEIVNLQTNPEYRYGVKNREVKHIGEAIIHSLKKIFNKDSIILYSTEAGKPLYEKMGFETVKDTFMILKR